MASKNQQNKTHILATHLTKLKREEEEKLTKEKARKLDLKYVDLSISPINSDDLKLLPKHKANSGKMILLRKISDTLQIALYDPEDERTKEILKEFEHQGYKIKILIASLSGLKDAWHQYDVGAKEDLTSLRNTFIIQKSDIDKFKTSIKTIEKLKKVIHGISTTELMTIIVSGAIEMQASDIHIEPAKQDVRLRYRIDGILQTIGNLPSKDYQSLISRVKTFSHLLLNVRNISQDGRFAIKIMHQGKLFKEIDVRVSILPSAYAETIVMRLLGVGARQLTLEDLGMRKDSLEVIKKQISRPHGLVLTTGPTGSGKTTTLYACLKMINKPDLKIITVEDPIEYRLEDIVQTQIDTEAGQSFAQSLKSIVRQDPDALMVGEIRDKESAEIAIRFALTGHIVLSTLHTNDAAGAIARLLDIGIEGNLITSTLNLVIAQRLVRKLCVKCKEKYKPSKEILDKIKKTLPPKIATKVTHLYKSKGCDKCHGLGYQGRIGIFEFFTLSDAISDLIIKKSASYILRNQAIKEGMVSLYQDGLLKVIDGTTGIEEIDRVAEP